NRREASWLRLADECSGAVLWTAVFPPRDVGAGARGGGARAAPPGVRPLGAAGPLPGRQRRPLGVDRRLPDRAGAVADRAGGGGALEPPAEPPGERRRRAVPGDLRPVVRAVDLRHPRGAAAPAGRDGPAAPRGLPVPRAAQPDGLLPGA